MEVIKSIFILSVKIHVIKHLKRVHCPDTDLNQYPDHLEAHKKLKGAGVRQVILGTI